MSPTPRTQEARREALRRRLAVTGDLYWDRYRAVLQAHDHVLDRPVDVSTLGDLRRVDRGKFVYLSDVDPTLPYDAHFDNDFLICRTEQDQIVGIKLDDVGYAQLGALRRARLDLGLVDRPNLELVGRVLETGSLPASWQGGGESFKPVVQVRGVRSAGQLAVFLHPKRGPVVPGLTAAQALLAELRDELDVSTADAPGDLLQTLLESLRLGDLQLFGGLWLETRDVHKIRRRFEHFRRAYDESSGQVVFQRYKDDRDPGKAAVGEQIQMFVERKNRDGSVVSKPLSLVLTEDGWRLKGGVI